MVTIYLEIVKESLWKYLRIVYEMVVIIVLSVILALRAPLPWETSFGDVGRKLVWKNR